MPPRMDGLSSAGNEVVLALPSPRSFSTGLTNRLRKLDVGNSATLGSRYQPISGTTPWQIVDVRLPEYERWLGLAGYPQQLCKSIATELLDGLDVADVDLVQGHGMYEFWAGGVAREIGWLLGRPFTITLHGSDINKLLAWRRPAFRRVANDALGVFFVSDALRQRALQAGLVHGFTAVTPNGIDTAVFNPGDREESPESLRLLFVGSLAKVKGADRLPPTVAKVVSRHPSTTVRVIGDGPLRGALEESMPTAEFLGRLNPEKVAAAMREADVLFVPSRSEGWPCVVLEAEACGARVVATAVGGLPEALGPSGALISADPFTADSAAETILRVRKSDTSASRLRAQGFDWRLLGERETDLIKTLVSQSRP